MAFSELDSQMKALEWFAGQQVPRDVYPILRIDGRGFSGLTARLGFEKPYDQHFHHVMGEAAHVVMENLGGIYAYHQSDEISILLPNTWDLFDRRVEKMISVFAGLTSAVFNRALMGSQFGAEALDGCSDEYPHFDARLVCALDLNQAAQYFHWRQLDATKNCLNSWAHWTSIQKDGRSPTATAKLFDGASVATKNEFLFSKGINFNDLPLWQRRGSGLYWTPYVKQGFNPLTQQTVEVQRWRIDTDHKLPTGEEYLEFIARLAKQHKEK